LGFTGLEVGWCIQPRYFGFTGTPGLCFSDKQRGDNSKATSGAWLVLFKRLNGVVCSWRGVFASFVSTPCQYTVILRRPNAPGRVMYAGQLFALWWSVS